MKRLNKKREGILRAYWNSNKTCLEDCYNNYSCYKARAEYLIKEDMKNEGGYDYRILGFNCMMFSCAYRRMNKEGKEELIYHTAYNKDVFCIE